MVKTIEVISRKIVGTSIVFENIHFAVGNPHKVALENFSTELSFYYKDKKIPDEDKNNLYGAVKYIQTDSIDKINVFTIKIPDSGYQVVIENFRI